MLNLGRLVPCLVRSRGSLKLHQQQHLQNRFRLDHLLLIHLDLTVLVQDEVSNLIVIYANTVHMYGICVNYSSARSL